MKIGFVTDTNFLHKSNELYNKNEALSCVEIFVDYIDSLKKAESKHELIYYMPEIVIEELLAQKRRAFNESYNNLIERYNNLSYGIVGEKPQSNIENVLQDEKSKYNDKYSVLKLNYSESIFKELVMDAINKNAPFDKAKDGKKTDAGFKDALIWKCVLYSNEIDSCNVLYFFSSDSVFKDAEDELKKEFKEKHSNVELKIIQLSPSGSYRQEALQMMISDNGLLETKFIKLYNMEMILNEIKGIKYNYSKEVSYNIDEQKIILNDVSFSDFDKSEFTITDVNEIEDNKFEVIVTFKTKKCECIGIEENEREIVGDIILFYKSSKNNFILEKYEIKNIKFYSNFFSNLISTSIRKYMEELKKSLEPLKNINIPDLSCTLPKLDTSYLFDSWQKVNNTFNLYTDSTPPQQEESKSENN